MPHSTRSSSASAPCRIDWRPSRWALCALAFLTAAALVSIAASELPQPVAWPLGALAAAYGLGAAWREAGARHRVLEMSADGVRVDGLHVVDPMLRWRGPLAFLSFRDARGRRRTLVWWPDTLPRASRRELRLAMAASGDPRREASVAP